MPVAPSEFEPDSDRDGTDAEQAADAIDNPSLNELYESVYELLRSRAHQLFAGRGGIHELEATELVQEAYVKLRKSQNFAPRDEQHVFRTAVRAMYQVFIDSIRQSEPHRLQGLRVSVDILSQEDQNYVDLMNALEDLRRLNQTHHSVIILRFFGGCTVAQVADRLGRSESAIEKDWRMARAWLRVRLRGPGTTIAVPPPEE